MMEAMRIAHGLVLASVTAGFVACSLHSVERGTHLSIRVDARGLEGPPGAALVQPFASASPPTAIGGFDCLGVNVTGPGIPDTSQNPEPNLGPLFDDLLNRRSYCTYRGILAGPVSATISGPQEIALVVPPGNPRLVQLVGLKEQKGSNDCVREFNPGVAPVIGPSGKPAEADAYELGRAVIGLAGDTTVVLNADWNGLSGSDQFLRMMKCDHGGGNNSSGNGSIATLPSLTVARDEPGVVFDSRTAPGKIFVTGGGSSSTESYTIGAGSWVQTSPTSLPAAYAPVVVPYQTSGYMNIGGATSFTNFYETSTDGVTWGTMTPIPSATSATGSAGRSAQVTHAATNATYIFGAFPASNSILRYDHPTSTITPMPNPLATGRENASATILSDGKIMIVGGDDGTNILYSCDIFDPATGAISFCSFLAGVVGVNGGTLAPLPNGGALLIGGATGTVAANAAIASTQTYVPSPVPTWVAGNPLPEARADAASVILNDGRIALFGGRDASGNAMNSTIFFSGTAWQHGPNLAVARYKAKAVIGPGGKVYIVGGKVTGGAASNAVEVWSP